MQIFCKKINAEISKIKGLFVIKGIFSETTYVGILSTKFHVDNIILTSFTQGGGGSSFTPNRKTSP